MIRLFFQQWKYLFVSKYMCINFSKIDMSLKITIHPLYGSYHMMVAPMYVQPRMLPIVSDTNAPSCHHVPVSNIFSLDFSSPSTFLLLWHILDSLILIQVISLLYELELSRAVDSHLCSNISLIY